MEILPTATVETCECPNCGAPNAERFCPRCGQDQRDPVRGLRVWVLQLFDELLRVDRRLPRSLAHLLLRPGFLTEEWIRGRRARYVSPLRLYLLSAVLFFPLSSLLTSGGAVSGMLEGFMAASDGAYGLGAVTPRVETLIPQVMLVLVPAAAALLHVFFSGRYYVEHLVLALHFHAAYFFMRTLIIPLADLNLGVVIIAALLLGWVPWYLVRSFRNVYRCRFGEAAIAAVLFMVVQASLVFGVAIALAMFLGRGQWP